ncbi:MAG: sulfatase-like hydrolase/transferase [Verrucomicrobiaceae bacterium]|nr:sulfatase-like hydrolase/transferase [Verrucomicrobiaceae bacterium]
MRILFVLCAMGAMSFGAVPNVIFMLTDNHGDWTLGCYGNKDIRTPNIDRLAAEGVRFANAYANNPVCSPNRATLLTGLMPSQHGVHNYLGKGAPQMGEGAYSTIEEFTSLGEIFRDAGYSTGMIGKWHLGANTKMQEGFEDAWITMPMGSTSTFFNAEIIENGEVRKEQEHLTRFWQRHAVEFVERKRQKPFFLYLPFNGPYGLGPAQLRDFKRAPNWQLYANERLASFPRTEMHPWQFNNKDYLNNDICIRRYGAELTAIDDAVGAVLGALEKTGQRENTLIVFAGDNGWSGGHHGLWGMGDHTRPKCAFEPTMRVPLIWWQPGVIKPRVVDEHVSHVDFFPSLLAHLGMKRELPAEQKLTGHDYSAALRGESLKDWSHPVFYEYEELRCVRTNQAKLILRDGDQVDELYDLRSDPGEVVNLFGKPEAGELQDKLMHILTAHFKQMVAAKYDLWNGGESKAHRLK